MLHLLLGTDWTANRDEVMKRIAADIAGRKGNRILMVPELISHETERRLCAAGGDTASRYAEVLSFTRLARRVADAMGSAAEECLDNGGRVVAMAAAAKNLASRLKAYAVFTACTCHQADSVRKIQKLFHHRGEDDLFFVHGCLLFFFYFKRIPGFLFARHTSLTRNL